MTRVASRRRCDTTAGVLRSASRELDRDDRAGATTRAEEIAADMFGADERPVDVSRRSGGLARSRVTFYPFWRAELLVSIFQLLLPIEDHFSLASGSASAVSSDPRHRTTRVDEVTYLSEDTNGRCRIE